jgi:hypothetical protein
MVYECSCSSGFKGDDCSSMVVSFVLFTILFFFLNLKKKKKYSCSTLSQALFLFFSFFLSVYIFVNFFFFPLSVLAILRSVAVVVPAMTSTGLALALLVSQDLAAAPRSLRVPPTARTPITERAPILVTVFSRACARRDSEAQHARSTQDALLTCRHQRHASDMARALRRPASATRASAAPSAIFASVPTAAAGTASATPRTQVLALVVLVLLVRTARES